MRSRHHIFCKNIDSRKYRVVRAVCFTRVTLPSPYRKGCPMPSPLSLTWPVMSKAKKQIGERCLSRSIWTVDEVNSFKLSRPRSLLKRVAPIPNILNLPNRQNAFRGFFLHLEHSLVSSSMTLVFHIIFIESLLPAAMNTISELL